MFFEREPKPLMPGESSNISIPSNFDSLKAGFNAALYGGGSGSNSYWFNRQEVWGPIIDEIESEYGETFENPSTFGAGMMLTGFGGDPLLAKRAEQKIYDWAEQNKDNISAELYDAIKPEAINQRSLEIKQSYERDLAELAEVDPGLGMGVLRFTGQVASGFGDPSTAITMPFGGWSKSLWKQMFQNAAINAGVGAFSEVDVARWYDELGLEYTAEQFAVNIGLNAAFGAALPVAGRGIATGVGLTAEAGRLTVAQAKKGWEAIAKTRPDAIPAEDRALATALDTQDQIQNSNPLTGFDHSSEALAAFEHQQRLDQAHRALQSGQRIEISEEPVAVVDPNKLEPQLEARGAGDLDNLDGRRYKFNVTELEVDAAVFQFKRGGDEFGVTERLQGVKEWDYDAAGDVMVFEYADGRRVIADGHQRLGLARRIMANDPSQDIVLYGTLKREVDGHTELSVRLDAAMKNIAEGTGTALDAATALKIDPSRLDNLPPKSALVQHARNLARLDDEAYDLVEQGYVDERFAGVVGAVIDDKELHVPALKVLRQVKPDSLVEAEAVARQVAAAPKETTTTVDLFGEQQVIESLYAERAKILSSAINQIKRDKAAFANINKNASRLEAEGNKIERDANQKRVSNDAQAIAFLQATANRKGPLSDALNNAARAAKQDGNFNAATDRFVGDIRGAIEAGDFDRVSRSDVERTFQPPNEVSTNKSEPQQEITEFAEPGGEGTAREIERLERDIFGDDGKKFPTQKEITEMIANDEIAPDYRYYLNLEDGVEIPTSLIKPIRARADGIVKSKKFMAIAAKSELGMLPPEQRMSKRGPVQVHDDGDGTYTLLDGNSTYAIASEAGMPVLPARVLTMEEFAAATQSKAMGYILKPEVKFEDDGVTPKKPKRRIVNVQDADVAEFDVFSREQKSRTPNKSLDEALERGEKNHKDLAEIAESIADELGIFVSQPKVKSRERAQKKLDRKYKNADGSYRFGGLTDIARTGFIIEKIDELDKVVNALAARGLHVINEGFEFTPLGYFDAKLNVIFEDNTMGEVQLWVPGMLEAKGDRSVVTHQHLPENASDLGIGKMPGDDRYMPGWSGHDYYEVFTDTTRLDFTPEMRLEAQDRQLAKYGAVQADLDDEFKAFIGSLSQSAPKTLDEIKASFSLISGDRSSVSTTAGSIEAQSPSPQARANVLSDETTTGVSPSILNQRMDVPPVTDVELRTEYTTTELTAAGEQVVIPGAERISDRELAQRKMDDLLTGRTDPMPEGSLFDEARTADLFDDPDMMIRLEDEDGNVSTNTISEIKQMVKDEDDFLKQLEVCQI